MLSSLSFRASLLFSIAFHITIIMLILYNPRPDTEKIIQVTLDSAPNLNDAQQNETNAIKAVNISAKEIENTLTKITQERENARKKREQKIAQEQLAAKKAKLKRIAEEKKLLKLKQQAQRNAEAAKKEREKLAALKKQQQLLEKKQAEQQEKARRAELARQAEQRRQQAIQAQAKKQARINEAVQKYKALILQAISQQWILPANVNAQLSCEFRIRLAPNGSVILARLSRSSGDAILDRSAETAINKASPLPVPQEQDLFELFRDIHLTVKPEQARG